MSKFKERLQERIERFKERLQERIERNAVKIPNISWTDKDGKIHTEDIILKRSRFPLIGDWSRIYPPINEDRDVNWINLIVGGKKNLIKFLFLILLIAMVLFAFKDQFTQYEALLKACQPCLTPITPIP